MLEQRGDILAWWRLHAQRLPNFSKLARKYLSIQSSNVASERMGSVGAGVITEKKMQSYGPKRKCSNESKKKHFTYIVILCNIEFCENSFTLKNTFFITENVLFKIPIPYQIPIEPVLYNTVGHYIRSICSIQ